MSLQDSHATNSSALDTGRQTYVQSIVPSSANHASRESMCQSLPCGIVANYHQNDRRLILFRPLG